MSKVSQPELKRFLEKRIIVNIQGGRKIQGTLRGYDLFLNLVVDDAVEQVQAENNQNLWKDGAPCGTVVRWFFYKLTYQVVRGNSVNSLEGLETINTRWCMEFDPFLDHFSSAPGVEIMYKLPCRQYMFLAFYNVSPISCRSPYFT